MIVIFSGLPGAGKSTKLAQTLVDLLYRNRKYFAKQMKRYNLLMKKKLLPSDFPSPQMRQIWSNLKVSKEVEKEFPNQLVYWADLRQLTPLRDVDVIIDEVSTYFDARLWETLSLEMRRWLAQHRKFGIEVYGTTQDFAQVDKAFRRLTSDLLHLRKLVGSADISPTRPPPKYIWGICTIQTLDPTVYDEQKSKFASSGLPRFMFITRDKTKVFNTRDEVAMSQALPLKHLEKECERSNCTFHKIVHV